VAPLFGDVAAGLGMQLGGLAGPGPRPSSKSSRRRPAAKAARRSLPSPRPEHAPNAALSSRRRAEPKCLPPCDKLLCQLRGCGDVASRSPWRLSRMEHGTQPLQWFEQTARVKPLGVACAELPQWGRSSCGYRTLFGYGVRSGAT
jgi:hypothetical protein